MNGQLLTGVGRFLLCSLRKAHTSPIFGVEVLQCLLHI